MKSKPPDLNTSEKIIVATNTQPQGSDWYLRSLHKKINVSNKMNIERTLNMSRGQIGQRNQMASDRRADHA